MMLTWCLLWGVATAAPLDLNRATTSQLEELPGIGPDRAATIVHWRYVNGPFQQVDDLLKIQGLGPGTVENLRSRVTVEEPAEAPPRVIHPDAIDINTASADDLGSLPGITPVRAAAIVAFRDANGPFASCHDLALITGIGPATVASIGHRCIAREPKRRR